MGKWINIFFLFGLLFLQAWSSVSFGQISAPDASTTRQAEYPSGFPRADDIFVICSSSANGDPLTSRLQAAAPGGFSNVDFEWSKYNELILGYDSPFFTETGVDLSEASDLSSGGYRVRVYDGGSLDTLFYAWLFIDVPYVISGVQHESCPRLTLFGDTASVSFTYYDPADNSEIFLNNKMSFKWKVDDPDTEILWDTIVLTPRFFYDPPVVDTRFYLTVTDRLGCTDVAAFDYITIHVRADMEPSPTEGEAPLEVIFDNKSKNAVSYYWDFGDEETSILELPENHIYYIPDEYEVIMFATSEENCTDSISFRYIKVEPSKLDIPNVFTPNGDTYNDYFIVAAKSLRYLHVKVLTRNGRKIYDFEGEGDALKEWEGWDGYIDGSRKASPGVYYYVIEALGWDDVEYKSRVYRGVLQIIWEK